jgi:hypothetical protein
MLNTRAATTEWMTPTYAAVPTALWRLLLRTSGLPSPGPHAEREEYIHFTTKFTSRPGATITFTTCFPAKSSAMRGSARAAASMVALSLPAGT